MDIVPVLNLNRHPRDCDDCSLIDAENVMLSLDQSVIVTEPSIVANQEITKVIEDYYKNVIKITTQKDYSIFDKDNKALYKIITCIECPDELVIFVAFRRNDIINITNEDKNNLNFLYNRAVIFRYRTTDKICKPFYSIDGGIEIQSIDTTIKGTFTYNVENSLIIAVAEYYKDENMIPLRTINLGQFDSSSDNQYSDINVKNELLSLNPEIYLPNMVNQTYIKGSTFSGWNYLFIRFKINSIDYTQWFLFGHPIYIDSVEQINIIKYGYNQCVCPYHGDLNWKKEYRAFPSHDPVGFVAGCSDYISNGTGVANITAKFNIEFNNYDRLTSLYGEKFIYQVGLIVSTKSKTDAYKSYDITNNNNNNNEFIINVKDMNPYNNMDLINSYKNYYNVKNITAYKNRLYISNYKEHNLNNKKIEDITKNIVLKCRVDNTDHENDFKYNIGLIRISTDIGTDVGEDGEKLNGEFVEGEFLNVDKQTYQFDCDVDGTIKLSTYLNISENALVTINNISYTANQVSIRKVDPQYNVSEVMIKGLVRPFKGKVEIKYGDNKTYFDTEKYLALTPIPYINTKYTFEQRIKDSTLIPGEVYNFFIHFIDKYGDITNGYKLENNTFHKFNNEERVCFRWNDKYVSFPKNQNVAKNGELDISNIYFHNNIKNDGTLGSGNIASADSFKAAFSSFSKEEYNIVKWYQITDCPLLITNSPQCFGYFENNNGDTLFKVPDFYTATDNKKHIGISVSGVVIPDGYVGYFISYEKFTPRYIMTGLLVNSDFRVNHYKTDKYEGKENQKYTRADILFPPLNFRNTNKMHFYSGQLDISDKLKFDYSILKLREVQFTDDKYKRYWQQAPYFKYPIDYNKPIASISENNFYYPMPKYKLAVADSVQDTRQGLGTCIEIDNDYNIFGELPYDGEKNSYTNRPKTYIATLINHSRDIYMTKEKVLIKCGDYYYNDNSVTIIKGLNGRFTYDGVMIYDGHGVKFNDSTKEIRGISNDLPFYPETATFLKKNEETGALDFIKYLYNEERMKLYMGYADSYNAYTPFMNYVQFGIYTDKMYESKSFKNNPKGEVYPVYSPGPKFRNNTLEGLPAFVIGSMVEPANSIDLFENIQDTKDEFNPKSFAIFRKDIVSVEYRDKSLRRSNVIKDESRENGWRIFPLEGYRDIAENKGKITNLYGVGTIFLVHTEHSLFMFDVDNTMKTENKSVQLYQPDTFEVDYKEVLTSDLGYGGLQNSKSWIGGQFGYIFYNDDLSRFFIFDNNQLGNPDEEIIEFLRKYHPNSCIFLDDKEHNRLLIKMLYINNNKENSIILSFNYDTKKFISRHTYEFEDGFNTKVETFMLFNDGSRDRIYQFVKYNSSYSIFENQNLINGKVTSQYLPVYARQAPVLTNTGDVYVEDGINTYFSPAKLKIVVNNNYSLVKFIEYITYKLYKINASKDDNAFSPVEERIVPFSGISLRVYNDQIDTGYIDILIDLEEAKNVFANYEKPYWDLGNWNFSYLRNTKLSNADDIVSRLYGNWFVFEFVINNDDNKVEFESLMVNLSKDKRV